MATDETEQEWVLCYIDKVIEDSDQWLLRLGYFVLSSDDAEASWFPDTDVGIEFGLLPIAAVFPASLVIFDQNQDALTSENVRLVFDDFPAKYDLTVTQDYLFLRIAEDVSAALMLAEAPPFRGCVLRVSTRLFREANVRSANDSFEHAESLGRLNFVPKDTEAFREWNTAVIENIKKRYAEKKERNLLSRFGRDK